MQDRITWVDIAKGLGIWLVVVGHTGRGLDASGLPDPSGFLALVDQAIYAFHMPFFFLLSGITFALRPPAHIQPDLTTRLWRAFYALVIWTYVFLAMRALAGSAANSGNGFHDLLSFPLPSVEHFWFLWALLLNIAGFAIARLVLRSVLNDVPFWIAAVIGALVLNAAAGDLPDGMKPWFGQAMRFSVVMAVGGLLGASSLVRAVPGPAVALVAGLLFAGGLWLNQSLDRHMPVVLQGLALSLFLIVPLMSLSVRFHGSLVGRMLARLGALSLAIYVMHTMFSAALRIGLLAIGIDDPALHMVLGTAVGLVGPVMVFAVADRIGVSRVMGLA